MINCNPEFVEGCTDWSLMAIFDAYLLCFSAVSVLCMGIYKLPLESNCLCKVQQTISINQKCKELTNFVPSDAGNEGVQVVSIIRSMILDMQLHHTVHSLQQDSTA